MSVDLTVGDALDIMPTNLGYPHTFTSLPDAAEMGLDMSDWRHWFADAVAALCSATDGYLILYQTDRRHDGAIMSKATFATNVTADCGLQLRWHKIAVAHLGTDLRRPTYSHLLCYSRRGGPGMATPDVYMQGPKLYPDAIDAASCQRGLRFLIDKGAAAVADPFCGQGTIIANAHNQGLDVIGNDIDPAQIDYTKRLLAMAELLPLGGADDS